MTTADQSSVQRCLVIDISTVMLSIAAARARHTGTLPLITPSLRSADSLVSDVLHGLRASGRVELFHGSTTEGSDSPARTEHHTPTEHQIHTERHTPHVTHPARRSGSTDDPPASFSAALRRDRARGCDCHARRRTDGILLGATYGAIQHPGHSSHSASHSASHRCNGYKRQIGRHGAGRERCSIH